MSMSLSEAWRHSNKVVSTPLVSMEEAKYLYEVGQDIVGFDTPDWDTLSVSERENIRYTVSKNKSMGSF